MYKLEQVFQFEHEADIKVLVIPKGSTKLHSLYFTYSEWREIEVLMREIGKRAIDRALPKTEQDSWFKQYELDSKSKIQLCSSCNEREAKDLYPPFGWLCGNCLERVGNVLWGVKKE